MTLRPASLMAALSLLAVLTGGCFTETQDGVFGPAVGGGDGDQDDRPFLSMQATPARGGSPLVVDFSLGARDRDGDALTWTLDFGDKSSPASGSTLPTTPKHTYALPGAYLVSFRVRDGAGESLSTLSIVVLEGPSSDSGETSESLSPTQGPEPSGGGGYAPPPRSSTSSSTSATNTSTDAPSDTNSSTGSSTETATSSESESSTSDTGSSTESETGTQTAAPPPSDTGTETGSSTESSTESPPESSSSSTTDPPL